jgi:hypothetical protein
MQYRVPQFIEQEAKILGPLTLRQALTMGFACAICFITYFQIGEDNTFLFLLIAVSAMGIAGGLSFLKIQGYELPEFLGNFMNYSITPHLYLWKRKKEDVFLCAKITRLPAKQEEERDLTIRKSNINSLGNKINFS